MQVLCSECMSMIIIAYLRPLHTCHDDKVAYQMNSYMRDCKSKLNDQIWSYDQMFTFSFAVKTVTGPDSYTAKIVPIDIPKNCIKYAENALIDTYVQAGLEKPKILPNTALLIGKNLHKMENKEPGARMRAIAEAYYKTFY